MNPGTSFSTRTGTFLFFRQNSNATCMVSSEGACAAYWSYGRFRNQAGAKPGRAA